MDELHFFSNKKKAQFKLKESVGPYIINTKVVVKEVEGILKQMKFKPSFTWSYDPLGIISKIRVEQNSTPYAHTPRPEIAQYDNQEQWTENSLKDAKEQLISQSSLQTPIPRDKEIKRPRESMPPTNFRKSGCRRKKEPKTTTMSNSKNEPQVITIE